MCECLNLMNLSPNQQGDNRADDRHQKSGRMKRRAGTGFLITMPTNPPTIDPTMPNSVVARNPILIAARYQRTGDQSDDETQEDGSKNVKHVRCLSGSAKPLLRNYLQESKKPTHHFLRHPIPHDWNAERPELRRAGAFGDVDATQRQRPERSCFKLLQTP